HVLIIKSITKEIISNQVKNLHLKGLSVSLDMVLVTTVAKINQGYHLVIAHDKEEAAYLAGDLQELQQKQKEDTLLFPSSYKVPYQLDEVENANVLQRTEILNRIQAKEKET